MHLVAKQRKHPGVDWGFSAGGCEGISSLRRLVLFRSPRMGGRGMARFIRRLVWRVDMSSFNHSAKGGWVGLWVMMKGTLPVLVCFLLYCRVCPRGMDATFLMTVWRRLCGYPRFCSLSCSSVHRAWKRASSEHILLNRRHWP